MQQNGVKEHEINFSQSLVGFIPGAGTGSTKQQRVEHPGGKEGTLLARKAPQTHLVNPQGQAGPSHHSRRLLDQLVAICLSKELDFQRLLDGENPCKGGGSPEAGTQVIPGAKGISWWIFSINVCSPSALGG